MVTARHGYELPLLLIGAFRQIIDELHAHLASLGFPDVRPAHGFALQAIGDGVSITELGRRLDVTKQAAAKTATALEALGYLQREPDPADSRAIILRRTPTGTEILDASARFFELKRAEWADELGADRYDNLLHDLDRLARGARIGNLPGWISAK